MELKTYFRTLWRRWWLILLCTACAGASSYVISKALPPVYEARVVLMSNQSTSTGIVDYSSLLGGQQMIETYRELLKTRPVLEAVIAQLNLPYAPIDVSRQVEVRIIPNTQLLELRAEDTDPQRAADIANEIAIAFLMQRSAEQQLEEITGYEQVLVEQMEYLDEAIERAEGDLEQLSNSSGVLLPGELTELQINQSQRRGTYATLLSAYMNVRAMKSRLLDLSVVEPARTPTAPVRPRKLLNTAAATAGGFAIACALALLLEYLNDTFEDREAVQEALALPNLGTIPFVRSWQRTGRARLDRPLAPETEAFRVLRTNLQFTNLDKQLGTLCVTSSVPGEGKSSVLGNLGTVMAHNGHKVLLVDADLRKPRLHHMFGVSASVGLTSLLLSNADRETCILETDVAGLSLLPSGPLPPNPTELLGSHRMAQLLAEFREHADFVMIDTPPVLACADPMVLASQTDGVILVIDSHSTRRETARQALEMLRNVEARVLGSVLNKTKVRSHGAYYYYGDTRVRPRPLKRFWPVRRPRKGSRPSTERT